MLQIPLFFFFLIGLQSIIVRYNYNTNCLFFFEKERFVERCYLTTDIRDNKKFRVDFDGCCH